MSIKAIEINNILKKYGYCFEFDMLHAEEELKKYEKIEKNFDRVKYLTIFNKSKIVIGRLYPENSIKYKSENLEDIDLGEEEIDKIIAFFTFFRIENNTEIINDISKLVNIDKDKIKVELITNNVYNRGTEKSNSY